MAVEIIGKGEDVRRYREYLHRQGILTKRFCQTMEKQGHTISPKPEGFRVFNTPIKSVYSLKKVDGVEKAIKKLDPDQRLFIQGVANANIIDRMDERLEPAGIDTRNFMMNPVLLLDHLYVSRSTVGKVLRLDPQSDGVHFDAFVGDPTKAPLTMAQIETRSLVAQSLLQTVSVGFIPHKVQAPEFGDEGQLINPAIILVWELLELSIVAVPANPGSVFDVGVLSAEANEKKEIKTSSALKKSDGRVNENKQDNDESTAFERIIFQKKDYTKEEAKELAKSSEYKTTPVEEEDEQFAFIQRPKDDFVNGSLKTIELNDGLKGVIGKLKTEIVEGARAVDKADQILDEIKRMSTIATTNGEILRKIVEQNEKIVASMTPDGKAAKEEEDEKPMVDEDEAEDKSNPDEDKKEKEKDKEEEDEDMEAKKILSEIKILKKQKQESETELAGIKEVVKSLQTELNKLSSIMLHFAEEAGLVKDKPNG